MPAILLLKVKVIIMKKRNLVLLTIVLVIFSSILSAQTELWGVTRYGGVNDLGVLFKYEPLSSVYTKVFDFDGAASGSEPIAGVTEYYDGVLYGLTWAGGTNGLGVIFSYNPYTDAFVKLLDFDGANNGKNPYGGLLLADNGIFYGMSYYGGVNDFGILFSFNPQTNVFTKLLDFDGANSGSRPSGSLMQASNGKLYGMTQYGGANNNGVIFEYDIISNTFSKLFDFNGTSTGGLPPCSLMQASNGLLYGVATYGATTNYGTLFQFDYTSNTFEVKVDFGLVSGSGPKGTPIEPTPGKIYGMSFGGVGVIYEFDLNTDTYTVKQLLSGSIGERPNGSLFLHENSKMYACTYQGGAFGIGTLFEYNWINNTIVKKADFNGTNGRRAYQLFLCGTNLLENTWDGSESSDWDDPLNWSKNWVPDATTISTIPTNYSNAPIINLDIVSPALSDEIIVDNGAEMTIDAGMGLTVNDITNNGTITIGSSVIGEGSLLVAGSISGSGAYNVQRYLTANQWHLVSSPITAGTAGVFNGIWLRAYDESTNTFGEYIVPDATPMPTGQGFSVWANSAETRTFSGTINNGSVGPLNAQLTGVADVNTGWNLMGNPYPSAIDWDAASGWTKTNLANAVYVWNGTQYATYIGGVGANGGSRYIAPTQGFFVQATSAGASLTMNNDVRVHNSVSYLKETNEPTDIIRLNITANGYSDETVLALRPGSLNEFDPMTDAVKLAGISEAPMVYTTKDDGDPLAISCVNSIYDLMDKVVYINYAQEGEHTLNWSIDFSLQAPLTIYDKVQNLFIPQNSIYTFFASYNDSYDRFSLVDNSMAIENENSFQNYIQIYDKALKIVNIENSKNISYDIYNVCGKIVLSSNAQTCDISSLASGIYNIVLAVDEVFYTQKVFIR